MLVVANDTCDDSLGAVAAPGVAKFHWLSSRLIRDALEALRLSVLFDAQYEYLRPVSGPRLRAVLVAGGGNDRLPVGRGRLLRLSPPVAVPSQERGA
jgi:hypothetical protein